MRTINVITLVITLLLIIALMVSASISRKQLSESGIIMQTEQGVISMFEGHCKGLFELKYLRVSTTPPPPVLSITTKNRNVNDEGTLKELRLFFYLENNCSIV